MVKGTKRKIDVTKKIEKSEYKATCFSKRSSGLYSKASQLCLLTDAQIAILATPSSSQSNVSCYSFGHSSVDSVVSAFLSGERPVPAPISSDDKEMREDVGICFARNDLDLGFWWTDERLQGSKNPEEIKVALESMSKLRTQLRSMKDQYEEDLKKKKETEEEKKKKKKDVVALNHETHDQSLDQTLNPQPISTISCVADDIDSPDYFFNNEEEREEFAEYVMNLSDIDEEEYLQCIDSNFKEMNKDVDLDAEYMDDEEQNQHLNTLLDQPDDFINEEGDDEYLENVINFDDLDVNLDAEYMDDEERDQHLNTILFD